MTGYRPIEDYGIVGDLRTVALVSKDGSIDWFCYPRFDSPSVFGAILDSAKGGHFSIQVDTPDVSTRQRYWPDTNVLVTRFFSVDGVVDVIDWMPVDPVEDDPHGRRLVREVRCRRGTVPIVVECFPAFDYARAVTTCEEVPHGVVFRGAGLTMHLSATEPVRREARGVTSRFVLAEGDAAVFVLHELPPDRPLPPPFSPPEADEEFRQTVDYWRRWLGRCTYHGRWREMVQRSALALKLLTYAPTGAIIAAPTTSLPETIGGERNWDYRYTWIRDAAFTVYALLRIGLVDEARQFMGWLDARCHEPSPVGPLQPLYAVDGAQEVPEQVLDHLEGYRGSRPVRIGNGAARQLQLDIYGELLDAAYLYNKHAELVSFELWTHLRNMLEWLRENWQRPDEGIWEVRSGTRQVVFSKHMSWVAFDRGLRLAEKRSFPAPRREWEGLRDRIYEEIMLRGWNEEMGSFVGHYDGDDLDASSLLMPLTFFVAPTDPRILGTLDAVMQPVVQGGLMADGLVYRYDPKRTPDGLRGTEGTFSLCTFWLVEALARAGRVDRARLVFEQMLAYSNHLGLYSEEVGSRGEALGNFPQAFTHLAFISAAFNLDRALSHHRPGYS